jgi:hypothetical protein
LPISKTEHANMNSTPTPTPIPIPTPIYFTFKPPENMGWDGENISQ